MKFPKQNFNVGLVRVEPTIWSRTQEWLMCYGLLKCHGTPQHINRSCVRHQICKQCSTHCHNEAARVDGDDDDDDGKWRWNTHDNSADPHFIFSHGEKWDKFRAQVQHVMLQPSTAKKYVAPLNDITSDFMERWVCVWFQPEFYSIVLLPRLLTLKIHEIEE